VSDEPFQAAEDYEAMLAKGIRLSGEGKAFFIEGRVRDLVSRLDAGPPPRRILDFGCGTGETTRYLAEVFRESDVVGVDSAAGALQSAMRRGAGPRVRFLPADRLAKLEPFDLCYANGVFHHIEPEQRPDVVRRIHDALRRGGHFALFENNPWSPAARAVMRRIPFDRDAAMLSAPAARRLLAGEGFEPRGRARFLFYFPRFLAVLRGVEPWLAGLPLGAQYHVLATR